MSEERLQEAIEYNDKKTDEMIDEIVFTRWIDPTIEEKDKEIERLNNIINELEKELFIKKEFYERELTKRPKNDSEYNTQYADSCALAQISVIYDKLQELKGSDK